MTDDWAIDSHTVDVRYRWNFGGDQYIQPHIRYYTQTEADFYQRFLVDAQPTPQFASADRRLGNFDGLTIGLKYGRVLKNGNPFNVRLEYYNQSGDAGPGIGNLNNFDLFPDVGAVILQFGYSFGG